MDGLTYGKQFGQEREKAGYEAGKGTVRGAESGLPGVADILGA